MTHPFGRGTLGERGEVSNKGTSAAQLLRWVVAPATARRGDMTRETLVTLDVAEASDSWGFVGVVRVGEFEAYRTIRAYASRGDALEAVQRLLGRFLGTLMAGQEWNEAVEQLGHTPLRIELGLIQGRRPSQEEGLGQPPPRHAHHSVTPSDHDHD